MDVPGGTPVDSGWATRVVGFYRAGSAVAAIVALLVANAIPIVGVAFFGWNLITILVLYWIENGIVGIWNIPKIALAAGEPSGMARTARLNGRLVTSMSTAAQRAFTVPFFLIHYGLFWVVHGVFVFAMPFILGNVGGAIAPAEAGPVVVGAIVLFASHGVSFFWNYVGQGEYRLASPVGQMFAPYGRLLILHLTIVLGAWPVVALGSPIGLLLVLVIGKTVLDLVFHVREHAKAATTA
jgi:uncharacterized protein DUF6498